MVETPTGKFPPLPPSALVKHTFCGVSCTSMHATRMEHYKACDAADALVWRYAASHQMRRRSSGLNIPTVPALSSHGKTSLGSPRHPRFSHCRPHPHTTSIITKNWSSCNSYSSHASSPTSTVLPQQPRVGLTSIVKL